MTEKCLSQNRYGAPTDPTSQWGQVPICPPSPNFLRCKTLLAGSTGTLPEDRPQRDQWATLFMETYRCVVVGGKIF